MPSKSVKNGTPHPLEPHTHPGKSPKWGFNAVRWKWSGCGSGSGGGVIYLHFKPNRSERANMKKMKSALWRKIHKIKDFLIANLHAAASNFCPFAG